MRPWHHGVMSLRLIFSGALFFLRQWILLPATLGLLEAGAAQRVANTSLNMPLDLPDGSCEVVDAFPGLRFSNPVAMVSLPGNDSLLFVVEKPGRIRKVHLGPSPSMETFSTSVIAFESDPSRDYWVWLFIRILKRTVGSIFSTQHPKAELPIVFLDSRWSAAIQ